MTMIITSLLQRGSVLLIAFALGAALSLTPHVGMNRLGVAYAAPRVIHIAGQITAVTGPSDNPTGFVLEMPDRSVDLRIVKKTSITARSAEALVDGLGQNDFALVATYRANGGWVATRIVYDVVPFGPIRLFTLSGSIARVAPTAHRFLFKLASGDTHWVMVNKGTAFLINGIPVTSAPALARNQLVDVQIRRTNVRWVALSVNIRQAQ